MKNCTTDPRGSSTTPSKPERPEFTFTVDIVRGAATLGITFEHLVSMVRNSSRITHPNGNRRYYGYLFYVEGDKVLRFLRLDGVPIVVPSPDSLKCESCKGTKRIKVYDQCPMCEGLGCNSCDGGLVQSSIACPACTTH